MYPPRRKYRNVPTIVDGIRFDSKAEAARWQELKIMQVGGLISGLHRQVRYDLFAGIKYVSDFEYERDGRLVTEDVKGIQTPVFKLKAKLFRERYGRDILITGGR
jgi:hypothetical protein